MCQPHLNRELHEPGISVRKCTRGVVTVTGASCANTQTQTEDDRECIPLVGVAKALRCQTDTLTFLGPRTLAHRVYVHM